MVVTNAFENILEGLLFWLLQVAVECEVCVVSATTTKWMTVVGRSTKTRVRVFVGAIFAEAELFVHFIIHYKRKTSFVRALLHVLGPTSNEQNGTCAETVSQKLNKQKHHIFMLSQKRNSQSFPHKSKILHVHSTCMLLE